MKNQKELPSHKIFVHSLLSSVNDILNFLQSEKRNEIRESPLAQENSRGFKNNAEIRAKDKG
jgi:hypothetical protein